MTASPPSPPSLRRPPAEEGSAYMIVLMLLFVLTIVGVSLSVVTQTEIIVGGNERSIQRNFYAADSGMQIASRRILRQNTQEFVIDMRGSASGDAVTSNAIDRVGLYPQRPIKDEFCPVSDISENNQQVLVMSYGVVVEATRFLGETGTPKNPVEMIEDGTSTSGTDGTPTASKALAVMAQYTCLIPPPNDELFIDTDPAVEQQVLQEISRVF